MIFDNPGLGWLTDVRPAAPQRLQGRLPALAILCGFTAQKNSLAFYVDRVPDDIRDRMRAAGFSLGKGIVRFRRADSEKLAVLETLLRRVIVEGITC